MTFTKKEILVLSIVTILTVYGMINYSNYYELRPDYSLEKLASLLMSYGVIALIVERFVNKVFLLKPSLAAKYARRDLMALTAQPPSGLKDPTELKNERRTLEKKIIQYENSFSWMSFGVSVAIASFGFKFFSNIFVWAGQTTSAEKPELVSLAGTLSGVVPLVDVFLTAVMIAGGASFIKSIIDFIYGSSKPTTN